jgi:hypothetical protein
MNRRGDRGVSLLKTCTWRKGAPKILFNKTLEEVDSKIAIKSLHLCSKPICFNTSKTKAQFTESKAFTDLA